MLTQFFREDDGAVTVDWVVLTAALVGIGFAVMVSVRPGISQAACEIRSGIDLAASGGAAAMIGGDDGAATTDASASC